MTEDQVASRSWQALQGCRPQAEWLWVERSVSPWIDVREPVKIVQSLLEYQDSRCWLVWGEVSPNTVLFWK